MLCHSKDNHKLFLSTQVGKYRSDYNYKFLELGLYTNITALATNMYAYTYCIYVCTYLITYIFVVLCSYTVTYHHRSNFLHHDHRKSYHTHKLVQSIFSLPKVAHIYIISVCMYKNKFSTHI